MYLDHLLGAIEDRRVQVPLHAHALPDAAAALLHGHGPVQRDDVGAGLGHALQEGAALCHVGVWVMVGACGELSTSPNEGKEDKRSAECWGLPA